MDELRDIKPLVPLSDPLPWWVWLAAAVLAVAAILVVWRRLRVRGRKPAPVVMSDAEAARLALAAVRGTRPADRASSEQLQTHVAMVLRRWVEARFDVGATEMTTEELATEPRLATALGHEGRRTLLDLFAFADAVRFAGRRASADEHVDAVERAWALIERSAP